MQRVPWPVLVGRIYEAHYSEQPSARLRDSTHHIRTACDQYPRPLTYGTTTG